jgi:hypothetical protein
MLSSLPDRFLGVLLACSVLRMSAARVEMLGYFQGGDINPNLVHALAY